MKTDISVTGEEREESASATWLTRHMEAEAARYLRSAEDLAADLKAEKLRRRSAWTGSGQAREMDREAVGP
jgi:hypothetical protein